MLHSLALLVCVTIYQPIEISDFTDIMLFDYTHSIPESPPVKMSVPNWIIRDNGKGNKVYGFNIFTSPDTLLSHNKDERELLNGPCTRNCSPPLLISVSNLASGIRTQGSVSGIYINAFKSEASKNISSNLHFSDGLDSDGNRVLTKNLYLPEDGRTLFSVDKIVLIELPINSGNYTVKTCRTLQNTPGGCQIYFSSSCNKNVVINIGLLPYAIELTELRKYALAADALVSHWIDRSHCLYS